MAYIKLLREKHVGLGKEKFKPLLDSYCKKEGVPTIEISTIGKVIKRKNLFFKKSGKIYHDPSSKWAQNKAKRKKRDRIKRPPKPDSPGYIEIDSLISLLMESRYIF